MVGFSVKETRFREDMDRLKRQKTKELKLKVGRGRAELLCETDQQLAAWFKKAKQSSGGGVAVVPEPLNIRFKDELGEGSGVRRAYYSALCEALLAPEPLPQSGSPGDRARGGSGGAGAAGAGDGGSSTSRAVAELLSDPGVQESEEIRIGVLNDFLERRSRDVLMRNNDMVVLMVTESILDSGEDTMDLLQRLARDELDGMISEHYTSLLLLGVLPPAETDQPKPEEASPAAGSTSSGDAAAASPSNEMPPLFFQPGKKHIFSPRPGGDLPAAVNAKRLTWYRHVGRIIGLCVLHNDLLPLNFNRHVIKFLLNRKVRSQSCMLHLVFCRCTASLTGACRPPSLVADWLARHGILRSAAL